MTAKIFYLKDSLAAGSNHLSLQDGGTAPTFARITTGAAITAGHAVPAWLLQKAKVAQTAAVWSATALPTAAPSNTLGDCFRSESTLNGTFLGTAWVLQMEFECLMATSVTLTGSVAVRLWKGTDPTGAGATEITSAVVDSTTFTHLHDNAPTIVTATWTPPALVSLVDEYLFVQVAFKAAFVLPALGADLYECVGPLNALRTSDFVPATPRYDKYGDVTVPTTAATAGATLATECDPTIDGLVADFKSIINTKCAAAYAAAMGTGYKSTSGLVVDLTFTHEPDPSIAKMTWSGPALFLWRAQERYFKRTNVHNDVEATVKLAYVMPPMTIEEAQKYGQIRTAIRTCLLGFIENKGDPVRKPGTLLSAYGLDSFNWTGAQFGYWDNQLQVTMPFAVLDMTALMRERHEWVLTQYGALTRADTTVTSKDDTGETTVLQTQYTP